ncbi:MAG: hypothetical protein KGL19_02760 [Bacteroidota bacterium]|nr:hypothetical protein [Bacteroidota bacterium]
MKKLFIAVLFVAAIGTSAFANPTTVNYKILNSFGTDFKGAENVSWKVTSEFVKASFVYENTKLNAFYNLDGELIGTSKTFELNKLPKKALETITKKYPYPPYKLGECIEMTYPDGEKNYFLSFEINNETLVIQVSRAGEISVF